MIRVGRRTCVWMLSGLLGVCASAPAQNPEPVTPPLVEKGQVTVDGHPAPYLVHRLPISSFPDLPEQTAAAINRRGCMVPQTYQAHRPENVVHASLERAGSSDWAVLCMADGTVSLLVFFGSNPAKALVLATAPVADRLQRHDRTGVLGFDWGIDPASPQQMRENQVSLDHHSPPVDHDALADSVIDHRMVYHFYLKGAWAVLDVSE